MYNRLPAPTVEIFPGAYARAAAAASDNLRHLSPDALAAGRTPDRSLALRSPQQQPFRRSRRQQQQPLEITSPVVSTERAIRGRFFN
jgi:hypothetical protein